MVLQGAAKAFQAHAAHFALHGRNDATMTMEDDMKPIILALAMVAAPASGLAQDEPPSVRVGAADLDLLSPEGRAALDRRVAAAVRKVCALQQGSDLQSVRNEAACRQLAFARARGQVEAVVAWRQRQAESARLIAAK